MHCRPRLSVAARTHNAGDCGLLFFFFFGFFFLCHGVMMCVFFHFSILCLIFDSILFFNSFLSSLSPGVQNPVLHPPAKRRVAAFWTGVRSRPFHGFHDGTSGAGFGAQRELSTVPSAAQPEAPVQTCVVSCLRVARRVPLRSLGWQPAA